jgi:hypothetical protein
MRVGGLHVAVRRPHHRVAADLVRRTRRRRDGRAIAAERLGDTRYIDALHASVDGNGRFEFQEVPPGRYVVGVNLRQCANTTAVATYHPGTPDGVQATVVEIGPGERRALAPMTLPPR